MKSVTEWNDKQFGNLIANYQRLGKVEEAYYLDALSEMARRKGAGLNFDKTFSAVVKARRNVASCPTGSSPRKVASWVMRRVVGYGFHLLFYGQLGPLKRRHETFG
ncbi:hypothetical protein ACC696_36405 [Rhizobium ruizarguesonis]